MEINKKYQEAVLSLTKQLCATYGHPYTMVGWLSTVKNLLDLKLPNNCRLAIVDENGNEVKDNIDV